MAAKAAKKKRRVKKLTPGEMTAVISLIVSLVALCVTAFTTYVSQRAYIVARAASAFNVSANTSQLQAYILIDNSGRTLAEITMRKVGVLLASTLDELGDMKLETGQFVAWPNQPHFIIRSPAQVKLTDFDIDKLNKSELKIFVFGKIEYRDIFNLSHETTFCHWYSGSETAALAPYGGRGYAGSQASYCDKFNKAN